MCASVRKAFYKLNKYAPFTMFGIQSNEKGDEFARTCILLFKTYFTIVHTWLKLIGNAFFSYIKYITDIITLKIQSMKSDVKRKIYLKKALITFKKMCLCACMIILSTM